MDCSISYGMKRIAIIGVWLAVLVVDGIVLPALTGRPAGLGVMVFLAALAITFGIQRWVIGLGIVLAGLTELMLGIYFGTIIGAWLVLAWGWHLLNRFLNMKPVSENDSWPVLAPFTLFGLALFLLGESASWAISRFAYEPGLSPATLFQIVRSPVIFCVVTVELVVILFIFHFIYSARNINHA